MAQEDIGKRFTGYQVYDRHYEKVGKVDGLFVDAYDRPEYIEVKIDFFGGQSTLVPMDIVRVNDARQLVEVASEKDAIDDAPSFGDDTEITAEFEDRVRAHFGMASAPDSGGYGAYHGEDSRVDLEYGERADAQAFGAPDTHEGHEIQGRDEEVDATDAARRKARELSIDLTQVEGTGSGGRVVIWDVTGFAEDREPADQHPPDPTGPEPAHAGEVGPGMRMGDTESGEFRGHAPDDEGVGQRQGSDLEDEDELRVQRSEEELRAGTREREAGSVNVRKRVRTDRERIEVPTRHEEVSIERVPVEGEVTEAQIGDDEVTVPAVEDEVVVQKKPVVKEEIRVRKDVVEETQVVEEDVRREVVEVEDATRQRKQ